jgi:undecaprenyl-diphosphatase
MSLLKVIVLAIVQGLAELLPVSSSAHVIVAEKLMGLDPSSPQMTLLLVMLHTGTMFAVIAYFWKTWKQTYFASRDAFRRVAKRLIWATTLTGLVGEGMKKLLERTLLHGAPKAEIEQLFSHLELIAPALAAVGVLILIAGFAKNRKPSLSSDAIPPPSLEGSVTLPQAGWMGLAQGLALPFRGFSRSGATISIGMLAGAAKDDAERFSFALAVLLTPAVVGLEGNPPLEGCTSAGRRGRAHRPPRGAPLQSARYGLLVSRRPAGAPMAEPLAGDRTLVSLRHLLPACVCGRLCPARARLLKNTGNR